MTDSLLSGNDLPAFDENKDYFSELVGEGKKFRDEKALAKGKAFSDHHIALIERENAERLEEIRSLREELNTRASVEEIIDQMKRETTSNDNNQNVNVDNRQPSFDPDQIESLISNKISLHERNKIESENFTKVQAKLREQYGESYKTVLSTQLQELGLSDEDAVSLAKKSPQAFFRQFGLDKPKQTESFDAPPASRRRNDSFTPTSGPKRTWSYYQNMKRTNPSLYWDPKTQLQKDRDYIALGREFEDGDFHQNG